MYIKDKKVKQDVEKDVHLVTLAADQGEPDEQLLLMAMYQEGTLVKKDLALAAYWEMRYSINNDGNQIETGNYDIDEFVQYIPEVLREYREFEKVRTLNLTDFRFNAAGVAGLNHLIRANTVLTSLSINVRIPQKPGDIEFDEAVETLTPSLRECNTRLTKFDITLTKFDITCGFYQQSPESGQQRQIAQLLEQNEGITEPRKYMQDHPATGSDELPEDVLKPLVDQMIVESIRGGKTKHLTRAAVDEFLLSVQFNILAATARHSG